MSLPLECGCQPVVVDGVLIIEQCETHRPKKRDIRWEDVYASKSPYDHFHDEVDEDGACFLCSCVRYQLDVYYKGGHYWKWLVIDSVDFHDANVNFQVDKWLWNEMIDFVDDQMKKVI